MKVRMRVDLSGGHNGRSWPARGEITETDAAVGAKLCSAGLAEPVGDHKADVETAVVADTVEKRGPGRPLGSKNKPKPDED